VNRFQNSENMRENQHSTLCKSKSTSNSQEPFAIKLIIRTNQKVCLDILLNCKSIVQEAIVDNQNNHCCIDILSNKDVESNAFIVVRAVLSSFVLSKALEDQGNGDVCQCDPGANCWTSVVSLEDGFVPLFAILLAISEEDFQAWHSIVLIHCFAIAMHLSKHVFLWSLIVC